MRRSLVGSVLVAALTGGCVGLGPVVTNAGHGDFAPKPVSPTRVQIGLPLGKHLLEMWRRQGIVFTPLAPPGRNVDALKAIVAADNGSVRGPDAYVFAVRYGRMTNPREGNSSGSVWVVMYRHDIPLPTACATVGCPASALHGRKYAQTNVVVDARSGQALSKFETL